MSTAVAEAVDVILRDGGTLRLRPPARDDEDGLRAFFEALSDQSRYLRFHGFVRVDEQLIDPFLEPDWAERGAYLASLAGDGSEEHVVALASYARLRDVATAEVALAVADGHHGRGIGTRLLEQLAERAREVGITTFVASVLEANPEALGLFMDAGFACDRRTTAGEIELRLAIVPTSEFEARVESRDHDAVAASLCPFFKPATVAVVGASSRRGSIGGELFRNVLDGDFAGAAYPVNPRAKAVAGVRAWPSIAEIPDTIDLAVICVPGANVVDAATSALENGVRALCVISAGFAEGGEEGRARQDALLAAVRAHGARLVGPNCLGIVASGVSLNATFAPRPLPPGRIGFSSQSGALGLALLEKAAARGLGFSSFISIGNKADVSSNDLLEWWEDDADTDVVLLYLESFGNPRRFARIARRVARRKPILALKAGTSNAGARAAGSHTAALAGSDAAADALFRQAGVVRARTLEELIDAAVVLGSQPLPRGRDVAVITNAGGLGILCADACSAAGLSLPELAGETCAALREVLPLESSTRNPIDLLGSATVDTYRATLPLVLADPNVDALIVLFVPPVHAGADEVAAAIREAVEAGGHDKPVLAVMISAAGTPAVLVEESSPVAALEYPETAAMALGALAERAEWLRRPAGVVPEPDGVDADSARRVVTAALEASPDGWLPPDAARALLEAYGVPVVPERVAESADAAVAAARELGFPVVVKSAVPGAHKTESGGIALDLGDDGAVRDAVARIGVPVLVQPMVKGGAELLAGVVQDPVFGPLVAFGPGGVLAELIGEASFRIAPLTDVDAQELVLAGKAGTLVRGFRGAPPASSSALVDLLHRLSRLADDHPEVAELDLNPVIASPDGCVAVDARIRVRAHEREHRLKSW
jgi:acetyl coenzyme A synthetase (ADP forming)-like protein